MKAIKWIMFCGAVVFATDQLNAEPITVARVNGSGNLAANTIFSSGALDGSIVQLNSASWNALSVADIAATYDAVLFGWFGEASANADWDTVFRPLLEAGVGIIFEAPANVSQLAPAIIGSGFETTGSGITVSATIDGLTDGITGSFVNNHMRFTSYESWLTPFLMQGTNVIGLAGEYGTNGGRIVLTGPDQDFHGFPGNNQYNLLINELRWVTSGEEVPEPSTMALWGLGTLGFGAFARRRQRKQQLAQKA